MINNQSTSLALDNSTNRKLLELDEELTAHYLEQIPRNLSDLKQAYLNDNITEIRFQSHKLIPAMVLVGKQEIAESLRKISDKSTNDKDLQSIIDNVINQIGLTLETLKN